MTLRRGVVRDPLRVVLGGGVAAEGAQEGVVAVAQLDLVAALVRVAQVPRHVEAAAGLDGGAPFAPENWNQSTFCHENQLDILLLSRPGNVGPRINCKPRWFDI